MREKVVKNGAYAADMLAPFLISFVFGYQSSDVVNDI